VFKYFVSLNENVNINNPWFTRPLTGDICNTLWHRLLHDYLRRFEELFVNSCFKQAICGAKAAPTPPDVGDEYSTYR